MAGDGRCFERSWSLKGRESSILLTFRKIVAMLKEDRLKNDPKIALIISTIFSLT